MTKTTKQDKDIVKLQTAIVNGLEDVKAHDIRVFDTTDLTPLFERVIVASGTSNRQTKALAASIIDKVREAGYDKPRLEGEANGEWIIVDCGFAVAHVMQPEIRRYYNLEEIWGEVPVEGLTLAEKKAAKAAKASKVKAAKSAEADDKPAKKAAAKKTTKAKVAQGDAEAKPAAQQAAAKKAAAKPAAAKKAPAKKTVAADKPAAVKPVSKLVVGEPVKKPAAKKAAAKPSVKKPAAKKAAVKKAAPKAE